jgi:hypothetical protein
MKILSILISRLRQQGFVAIAGSAARYLAYILRFNLVRIKYRGDAQQIFRWIYRENIWGDEESRSGTGSSMLYTKGLRSGLGRLFRHYKIGSIVDAGCGDFNWMSQTLTGLDIKYHGIDIVPEVIETLHRKYSDQGFNFSVADIRYDNIPSADLLICRDVLFHMSLKDIRQTMRNFMRSDIKYALFTSHLTDDDYEFKDIATGDFRFLDLEKLPFLMKSSIDQIDDWIEGHTARRLLLFRSDDFMLL